MPLLTALMEQWKTCPPAAVSLRKLQLVVFGYLKVKEEVRASDSAPRPAEELEALMAMGAEGRRLKIDTPQQYLERMYGRTQ